jgi:kinesin family protein 4/21/27
VKSYVSKIHDLEGELTRLRNLNVKSSNFVDWVDSDALELQSKSGLYAGGNEYSSMDITGNVILLVLEYRYF